jgi:hypothetical protein
MTELRLKFKDENGVEKQISVEQNSFIVGRHSENDLSILDGRLSREHVKIERVGDGFVVSDLGSSNGTTLNGDELLDSKSMHDGDVLVLGGGVEIVVEIALSDVAGGGSNIDDEKTAEAAESIQQPQQVSQMAAAPQFAESDPIPKSIFFIAPVLGLFVLVLVGGLLYFLGGNKQPDIVQNGDDPPYSTNQDEDEPPDNKDVDEPANNRTSTPLPSNGSINSSTDGPANSTQPSPQNLSDTAKIEQNGSAFLRRIAQNDPKAFLTADQAQRLNSKVKQFAGSSAIADNINSAKRNAAQIRSLATSKNLKPQFLAVAAIAKLGGTRGDVLQTANGIADVFDKLGTQVGNELADDTLLMVAAYDQGAAGDFMKMRNMLQDLTGKYPESTRTIRTIWFLQKNGNITPTEFDRALNFLAVGTITQNPKDFGVTAEPLNL